MTNKTISEQTTNKANKTNKTNNFLKLFIRGYRRIRELILDPLLYSAFGSVSQCKYDESCSHYAERMLGEHATIPALGKIVRRIWSCHS